MASEPLLLGVRHHGPGSARAVRRALAEFQPEVVLIEGPPEADALVPFAGDEDMRAPVALLAYPADNPDPKLRASFWPLAEFSPEWQAIRWAVAREVPVRFIDMPAAVRLAAPQAASKPGDDAVRLDPIGALAEAAGYDDPERWWEDVVEHRFDDSPFAAIAEAMTVVRAHAPVPGEAERVEEERREAYMRIGLRTALKEFERVAVVCGAWHVPALTGPLPTAAADNAVVRGLPKIKVAMTWVPWTHARLASWQGYGAGVRSPGWYHHLFTSVDAHVIERWLVRAAGVLRKDGVPVSSAHVIEATRLADALATMRGRPLAGLAEVTDAAHAVLCDGDDLRLALINRRLVVGDRLGRVPDRTPGVPIARDVAGSQRRLRLPPRVERRELKLDLRQAFDLDRSRLLHRLRLLGVEWGKVLAAAKGKGTFREEWEIAWQPEFAVDLVEAGAYGTTVLEAATSRVAEQAASAATLADVTALVERCLLADLPDALPGVLDALDERMALDADVAHLMDALPALARTLRYGDVRGTDLSALRDVTLGMITRICVGLPAAVGGLDDTAAAVMRDRIDGVQGALALVDDAEAHARWQAVLAGLSTRDDLHGLLTGRMNRLLLDAGAVDVDEIGARMALVLTVGVPVARTAAWIEGFLAGDGLLLVHDERLLALVDAWLTGIPADAFVEVLPLLRRTFSGYPAPQRRMIGERAANIGTGRPGAGADDEIDAARGALLLPVAARLMGRELHV
ncbi:DUF5682 family protein [Dactylosporangium sp. McL0621]|uniref:DUF5682 family protein n=1 Tax=Dactylosporangium sp. McL0621 TaxID=3415678 RepID=UPI003CE7D2BE